MVIRKNVNKDVSKDSPIGVRFREVLLERDLTVRPRLRTRLLFINQTKKKERLTHSQVFSEMLIYLKSTNDRTKILGYLCSYIHLRRNQFCICICKIPLCLYNLRSCYTRDFFHHIRQYLGEDSYYKNHSVTLQSKRRKYLHDIWTVELAA